MPETRKPLAFVLQNEQRDRGSELGNPKFGGPGPQQVQTECHGGLQPGKTCSVPARGLGWNQPREHQSSDVVRDYGRDEQLSWIHAVKHEGRQSTLVRGATCKRPRPANGQVSLPLAPCKTARAKWWLTGTDSHLCSGFAYVFAGIYGQHREHTISAALLLQESETRSECPSEQAAQIVIENTSLRTPH